MRTLVATLIALMLFATTPVAAGGFEDGYAAYAAGDYQKALRIWKPFAEQGNVLAQFRLGRMYEVGEGVPQNYAKAVYWYTRASHYVRAQFNLGAMYQRGAGVPVDHAKAVHWYSKAAKLGFSKAQGRLGLWYAKGEGVPENDVRAYAWVSIAAAQGDADAKKNKGIMVKYMTPTQIAEAQKLSLELWEKYVVPFQKK
jgi:uncharacterized protein